MNGKGPVEHCGFTGPGSIYAKFTINTFEYKYILVAHEGHWTEEENMMCHRHYKNYEDVQADLGTGFVFSSKEYVSIINRSFFMYEREFIHPEDSIVVPATGEEIYFEIYGVKHGRLNLLWRGEV